MQNVSKYCHVAFAQPSSSRCAARGRGAAPTVFGAPSAASTKELSTHTDGFDRYVRTPQEGYVNYAYERFHEGEELLQAYINAAGRAQRKLPPPLDSFKVIVARKFVNVASKVQTVLRKLWNGKKVRFLSLFQDAQTRSDMVATFLAVLELAKTKKITIDGTMEDPDVQIINEVNTVE